jgi:hypothetical protein
MEWRRWEPFNELANDLPSASHDRYIDDLDVLLRLLLVYTCVLDPMNDVEALDGSSKDGMLSVKPWL